MRKWITPLILAFTFLNSNGQEIVKGFYKSTDKKPTGNQYPLLKALLKNYEDSNRLLVRKGNWQNSKIGVPKYFVNGKPVFLTTTNVSSAQTISTDKMHLATGLSGSGSTIYQWDGGRVRTTHQEFGARVQNLSTNSGNDFSAHSTHVAGTIVANGINPSIKGMAFNANLRAGSYSSSSLLQEMADAGFQNPNGFVSNHSYGEVCGWHYKDSFGKYLWYGDSSISKIEDFQFGYYSYNSYLIDLVAYNSEKHLLVFAAGNDRDDRNINLDGRVYLPSATLPTNYNEITYFRPLADFGPHQGYNTISPMASTKNTLVVGAVYPVPGGFSGTTQLSISNFSSWGPTDDGRIKPDIVADGVNVVSCGINSDTDIMTDDGTSMAAPAVTGSAELLRQRFFQKTSYWPNASTVKGIIIHTADSKTGLGKPDYAFGWGLMNTLKASDFIDSIGKDTYMYEGILYNNKFDTLSFYAEPGNPVIATICWTDPAHYVNPIFNPNHPEWYLNNKDRILNNNLDIRLFSSTSITTNAILAHPYTLDPSNPSNEAQQGNNTLDNVEKIFINVSQSGTYYLVVKHTGTLESGFQKFSLLMSNVKEVVNGKILEVNFKSFLANYNELKWDDFSSDEISYKVERKVLEDLTYTTIKVLDANTIIYRDTAILPHTLYQYRIIALQNTGREKVSNIVWLLTPNPPLKATGLALQSISVGGYQRSLQLNWIDNAANETGYVIEHSFDSYSYKVLDTVIAISGIGQMGNYNHVGLPQNSRNYYRIKTLWNNFSSAYSDRGQYSFATLPTKTLNTLEFYVDNFSSPKSTIDLSGRYAYSSTNYETIPMTGVPEGLHTLYIRTSDNTGQWGNYFSRTFLKTNGGSGDNKIVKLEYYFDDANPLPGFAANSFDANSQTGPEYTVPMDIAAVSEGLHTAHLRTLDNHGTWSNVWSGTFLKLPGNEARMITKLECYIDHDPGVGAGTNVAINQKERLDTSLPVSVSLVSDGVHILYLRAKDAGGLWSNVYSKSFVKMSGTGGKAITQIEYYFNTDPGLGNGNMINYTTPVLKADTSFTIELTGIPDGMHTLYARAKDLNGQWSNIYSKSFLKTQGDAGVPRITRVEYYIDSDPGFGLATTISSSSTGLYNVDIPINSIADGEHVLYIRAKDNRNMWSVIYAGPFRKVNDLDCPCSRIVYSSGTANALSYQWQVDDGAGAGFQNIHDGGVYFGTRLDQLKISNPPTTYSFNKYRCIIKTSGGDTNSSTYELRYKMRWKGDKNTDWNDSDNWGCYVLPDDKTDIIIPGNKPRYPSITQDAAINSLKLEPGSTIIIKPGITLDIKSKQ